MFIKFYEYKIKKQDFQKWKKINVEAQKIYKKHGLKSHQVFTKKEKNLIKIVEIDYYNSKKDFFKVSKNVNKEKQIKELFNRFLKLVHNKKIKGLDFNKL